MYACLCVPLLPPQRFVGFPCHPEVKAWLKAGQWCWCAGGDPRQEQRDAAQSALQHSSIPL